MVVYASLQIMYICQSYHGILKTHTYRHANQSNFKKPHAWFKNNIYTSESSGLREAIYYWRGRPETNNDTQLSN